MNIRLFGALIAVCASFALGFMQGEINQLDTAWSLCQKK